MATKKTVKVNIKYEFCKRCEICVRICPTNVFGIDRDGYPEVIHEDKCIDCKLCETHCPDFAVWIQHNEEEKEHPMWNYLRMEHQPSVWCPGCGIGIVFQSLLRQIDRLKIPKDKIVFVSGIGCTGRMPGYADFNTVHTTHGRALAFATGIKLANPELKVIVVLGDGDGLAIGGNHLIHAARRNIDITSILVNNFNYGMTGGQVSPTTPENSYTTTSPYGQLEPFFNTAELAIGAGANYVGRATTYHVPIMDKLIREALEYKGFSLVEVLSHCPTYYGRLNRIPTPFEMLEWQKKMVTRRDEPGKYKIGVLHKGDRVSLIEKIEELKKRAKNGK